ncbi:hypothetical protein Ah1_00352 [Aeromonas phage Ah1]|uniref:Uncharacterized protein n=1 Tax=Aeromonas phage Ah1 TaxID=2053701 RepID=A0A2H4YFC9_9CAUD|nr:Ndd-like nucleoid disruption protein [Aeromonas phage Ah1]AUE22870.1 hypothetical protein Ah1_00352 [Aeromonas phage Ah1]
MKTKMYIGNLGSRYTYIGSLFPNKEGIIEFKNCQNEKIGSVNHDLTTPGFYLIGVSGESNLTLEIVTVNHVGIQKRKSGFKEILNRMNNPRTEQNKALGDFLCKRATDIFNNQRLIRALREVNARHRVYFMTYAQMRDLLGIEEYSAKNNGLAMITELRTKYKFFGRQKS